MELEPALAQSISAARLRLCARSPFFGALALFAHLQASDHIPTAATDGRDIYINPAFFGELSPAEQEGVLLHEVLHAALLHVTRRTGRDPKSWNIAADIVVNGIIAQEGYVLPPGAVRNKLLENLSVEEVYERLGKGKKPLPALPWSDLLPGPPGEGEGAGPGETGQLEAERQAALEAQWRQAMQQARVVAEATARGAEPASLRRELGSLRESQLDWRSYLWRFLVQTPTDFTGFDRRFIGQRLYLETLAGESVRVQVAVDTSGSVDKTQLNRFLSEVQAIVMAYPQLQCDLYFVDSAVHGPFPLTGQPMPTPVGGGGTDFRPFFKQISDQQDPWTASVSVYLTDGYGRFPVEAPPQPVLWVVTPGGLASDRFPFGDVIRLVPG